MFSWHWNHVKLQAHNVQVTERKYSGTKIFVQIKEVFELQRFE